MVVVVVEAVLVVLVRMAQHRSWKSLWKASRTFWWTAWVIWSLCVLFGHWLTLRFRFFPFFFLFFCSLFSKVVGDGESITSAFVVAELERVVVTSHHPAVAIAEPGAPPVVAEELVVKCPRCGRDISSDENRSYGMHADCAVCHQCGSKVSSEKEAEPCSDGQLYCGAHRPDANGAEKTTQPSTPTVTVDGPAPVDPTPVASAPAASSTSLCARCELPLSRQVVSALVSWEGRKKWISVCPS